MVVQIVSLALTCIPVVSFYLHGLLAAKDISWGFIVPPPPSLYQEHNGHPCEDMVTVILQGCIHSALKLWPYKRGITVLIISVLNNLDGISSI